LSGRIFGAAPQEIRVYRNTRADLLYHSIVDPGEETPLDLSIDVLAGDRLYIAVSESLAGEREPVAIAAQLSPAGRFCPFALRFDEVTTPALLEECGGRTYTARRITSSSVGSVIRPMTVPSVIAPHGTAIRFNKGDYLLPGEGSLDYSGSVSVQWWMRFPEPGEFALNDETVVFSDTDDTGALGLDVVVSTDGRVKPLFDGESSLFVSLSDHEWHHFRFVRDADANMMYVCRDGHYIASRYLPATNVTSNHLPYIGHDGGLLAPYFNGVLDDIRVVYRALPCETPVHSDS
jgi:hypothetical protein